MESGPPEKKRIFEIFDRELTVYAPGLYEFPSTKIWIDLTLANDISASTPTKEAFTKDLIFFTKSEKFRPETLKTPISGIIMFLLYLLELIY